MTLNPALAGLGDEKFVSLSTFRRSGQPVSTPVWIARDGDTLIVTTPIDSGKVKRLRNSGRVELRPSSRMGKVADDAVAVSGRAVVVDDDASRQRLTEIFGAKYGFEYRLFLWIEARGKAGAKKRVMIRIESE